MLDLEAITRQVLHNCAVSDSRAAGLYTVCGLALRLRDLYKWEKGLDPWVEHDSAKVLEWIGEKEEEWERLATAGFQDIKILGAGHDPFDTQGINTALEPEGLFYGAGYVHSVKPTFFLARLEEKKEAGGHPVYILGKELARDILTIPALSQGDSIVVRMGSARFFLWDKIFFARKSARNPIRFALERYGLRDQDTEALRQNLSRLLEGEVETYIHHELGGLKDTIFDRDIWRNIIAGFPHTPIELLARAVKDLLADTNEYGALRHITRERKAASIAFYAAFLDGLRRMLFPQAITAFQQFASSGDWGLIEEAILEGHRTAKQYAEVTCGIYEKARERNDMDWAEKEIEECLLAPLGIVWTRPDG